ncbi:MAG: hypothetical protein IJM03_08845, partial [Treponema sp.]|nr:hypothetical protein [Treponema sp.]
MIKSSHEQLALPPATFNIRSFLSLVNFFHQIFFMQQMHHKNIFPAAKTPSANPSPSPAPAPP